MGNFPVDGNYHFNISCINEQRLTHLFFLTYSFAVFIVSKTFGGSYFSIIAFYERKLTKLSKLSATIVHRLERYKYKCSKCLLFY